MSGNLGDLEHDYIRTNGITLHTVQAGPKEGEPILLLHGFPEFWYGWRHQIPFLAEAGYRVVAPDQRGYNLSDKPGGVDAYRTRELVADAVGLMSALGHERFHLVGHDWGGAVAWMVATHHPERLKTLSILNSTAPMLLLQAPRKNLRQARKSWYIAAFQIPWLPEAGISLGQYAWFARSIRRTGRPDTFTEEDMAQYRIAWGRPGAMRATINWYRAVMRGNVSEPQRLTVKTQILWGEKDTFLEKSLGEASAELCDEGRFIAFPDATHWLQHDEREAVNRLLQAFTSA